MMSQKTLAAVPAARGLSDALGGAPGRFADTSKHPKGLPGREAVILLVAAVFLVFGYLTKLRCSLGNVEKDGTVSLDWSGHRQNVAACYSDIIALYNVEGLKAGHLPYAYMWVENNQERRMEYPVLAGMFQYVIAQVTRFFYQPLFSHRAIPGMPEEGLYFLLSALVLGVFWLVTVWCCMRLAGNRVIDILLVAASPVVAVHAFTNYDTVSTAFAMAAMLAASRRKPVIAGILIGLGTAFKLWPLFLLGALLITAVRKRQWISWWTTTVVAVTSWIVVNAPLMLAYPAGWKEFFRLNTGRGWEWTTIYAVISRIFGWQGFDAPGATPVILNQVSLVLFLLSCVGIFILGLRAPIPPTVTESFFLIVAAFLLTNKVWSPQYSLWLVPLAVLALPRWRLIYCWMIAEAMVWPILFWHMLPASEKGLPHEFLDIIVLTRDSFVIAMIVLIIRAILTRRCCSSSGELVDEAAAPMSSAVERSKS